MLLPFKLNYLVTFPYLDFFLFWGGLGSVFNIVPVLWIISDLWICASDTEPEREAPAENNEADFLVIKDKKQKVNFETRPVGR